MIVKESREKELQELGIQLPVVGLPFSGSSDLTSEDVLREFESEDILSGYPKELPYSVESSYFDSLKPKTQQFTLGHFLKPLAVAASVFLIIGFAYLKFKNHSETDQLAHIHTQEMIDYVSENADEFDLETLAAYVPEEQDLIEFNDAELEEFLKENEI